MPKTFVDEIVEKFVADITKVIFDSFVEHYNEIEQDVCNSIAKRLQNWDIEPDWMYQRFHETRCKSYFMFGFYAGNKLVNEYKNDNTSEGYWS